jgi:hypothetical protein
MQLIYVIALFATCALAFDGPAARPADGPPGESKRKAVGVQSLSLVGDPPHWAFQPIRRIEPPMVQNTGWAKTPVDRFILAQLEANGLSPAPRAGKEELIRRTAFDLVGLPPTPAEIDDFVNDPSPDAYAKLIDRLLASPHYGERWGRHWLDVARFAETDGFEHDTVRPHAWRYRDYVIQSFNLDKPYDRFIREQIAGDQLYPEDNQALLATAFNLLGPDMVDSSDQVQRRQITLNDMTDTAAQAFLGITLSCARCHNHKFEPLTQKDYYRFQAFFTPAVFRNDLPVPSPSERQAHQAALDEYNRLGKSRLEELAALEAPYRQKLYERKLAKLSPEAQAAIKTPAAERTTEQSNQIQETEALLEVTDKEILNSMSQEDQSRQRALKTALGKLPKPPALPMTLALQDPKKPAAKAFILVRGDHNNRGDQVQPGFPSVLEDSIGSRTRPGSAVDLPGGERQVTPRSQSQIASEATRRADLAEWLASSDNPLTARVMVNRIWQHHFGRGIVPTPSDFGRQGLPPTHPDLLDWLATEFIASGWSVKEMHKLLLLSSVYQQSSRASAEALARDPGNQLYSRRNRLRLEGEIIRDSLLAVSGALSPRMGGPGVFPPIPDDLQKAAKAWTVSRNPEDRNRRSIYIFSRRNLRFPFLEVFDAPDSNLSCPERSQSTSAPQSLALLNADEVLAASRATVARLMREAASNVERIKLAYRLTLGRGPTEREQTLAAEFLKQAPWSEFCRALFNLNAFVYVD